MLHWRFPRWHLSTFPVGLAATVAPLNDDDDAIRLPAVVVTIELEVLVVRLAVVLARRSLGCPNVEQTS